jgi:hypothetical protein
LINVFRFVICSSLLNLQDPGFMFETSWPWVSGPWGRGASSEGCKQGSSWVGEGPEVGAQALPTLAGGSHHTISPTPTFLSLVQCTLKSICEPGSPALGTYLCGHSCSHPAWHQSLSWTELCPS